MQAARPRPLRRLSEAATANDNDLAPIRRIDELFTACRSWLTADGAMLRRGHAINRKRVQRLMRRMALRRWAEAADDETGAGHKIFPYLLRGLAIERPNQVWQPISPMCRSARLPLPRCGDRLGEPAVLAGGCRTRWTYHSACRPRGALARFGKPEIFNTDQVASSRALPSPARWLRGHQDLHGRARPLDGQRVHRAAVAVAQIRDIYLKGYADAARRAPDRRVGCLLQRRARTRRSPIGRR